MFGKIICLGGFEDATLVYSKRFIEAQDPDREPIPNVPNPHLITPFWLPNVLETYPFFHTFHRPRMSIICLLISKNEKPERFRIWRFRAGLPVSCAQVLFCF